MSALPSGKFSIVYADPPWSYYGDPNKDQAAGKHYQLMGFMELAELPVAQLLAKPALLFMWATSPKLNEAVALFTRWGCSYRGVFQVWVKTSQAGKIIHGQGVRPSLVKPTAEYLLWGSNKPKGRPLPLKTEAMANVVLAPRPGNVHSKKPDCFRDAIVQLLGDLPRIELFARQRVAGWEAWGDEV